MNESMQYSAEALQSNKAEDDNNQERIVMMPQRSSRPPTLMYMSREIDIAENSTNCMLENESFLSNSAFC